MIDLRDLLECVIRPTLAYLDQADPGQAGISAEALLLGTAVQESVINGTMYLRQGGGGPALGIYQIEPDTAEDVWENFIEFRPELRLAVVSRWALNWRPSDAWRLTGDLSFATAIARQCYRRQRPPLPDLWDPWAVSGYWKQWFNTTLGSGTRSEFAMKYREHVLPLFGGAAGA